MVRFGDRLVWTVGLNSTDQYHVPFLRAILKRSSRSHVYVQLTAAQLLVFDYITEQSACQVNLL